MADGVDKHRGRRINSLINLCARAGLLMTGEENCEKALRSGKARLVIVSRDASDNTKKKFSNKAFFYGVPVIYYGQKQELGKLTGKSATSSMCVMDDGFAGKIKDAIETSQANSPGGI